MKENKKGFTLIELLVAIVLMLSIAAVAIVAYSNISKSNKNDQYNSVTDQIETAAEQYFTNNSYLFDNYEQYGVAKIRLKTLVKEGFIGVAIDPKTKKKINECSYVEVIKHNGAYTAVFNESNETTCSDAVIVEYNPSRYNEIAEVAPPEEPPIIPDTIANNFIVSDIDYYDKNYNKISKNPSNNYFNILSFNENGIYETSEQELYVCADFSETEVKDESKLAEELKYFSLITPNSDEKGKRGVIYTNNIGENNQTILYCNSYYDDFKASEMIFEVKFKDEEKYNKQETIGKDTIAPEIEVRDTCFSPSMGVINYGNLFNNSATSNCNHIHIRTNGIVSYISTGIPSNELYFKSHITDNIEVDRNSINSDSDTEKLNPIITGSGASYEFAINGADVKDELSYNLSSTGSLDKYGYLVDLEAKDAAGNYSTNDGSVYGYIPCDDGLTSSRRENFIDTGKFCVGTSMFTWHNDSIYDNGLWPTKFLCVSDRSYEIEDENQLCILWVEVKKTIWKLIKCFVANLVDGIITFFTGQEATSTRDLLCPINGEIIQEEKVEKQKDEGGTFGFTIEVYNGSSKIFSKDYSRTGLNAKINKNESFDLNTQVGKSWFNKKDYPNGLTLKVRLGGKINSYSYSLDNGNRYKYIETESTSDSKSNVVYDSPQLFTYNIKNDGENRKIKLNVNSKDGDSVSIGLTFDMDRSVPKISWPINPRKAQANDKSGCGTNGLTAKFQVNDDTSGADVAYYYYGENSSDFDNSIQTRVSHIKGSGETIMSYTDVWTSVCSHSICSGGSCYNSSPKSGNYWHKVKAYDKAGNVASDVSASGRK